ncbi:thyrotropin-releasing hormone receptor [Chironomus tepperi]|uniref:thyrotropin-releasing hormone receptor n=1 Tax=Chironomus tepperi TaxID=113505 RepID=UPI00391F6130
MTGSIENVTYSVIERNYQEYADDLSNYSLQNHTNATHDRSEHDLGIEIAYLIGDFLTHYYTPALVLIGTTGNILSVIVFFKTKLRKLSSSYYLAALGISDSCFLLGAFVSWLNYYNINIYNRDYYCQFFTYVSGLCSFLSVWFVVAFTVERFIAVLYPLKRQTICTVKRACTVLFVLCVLGCLINIPCLLYAAPQYSIFLNDYVCDVREDYKYQMQIFNYIDTAIVFVLPFTTIVILNTFTAAAVWKVAGVRRTMTLQKRANEFRSTVNNHSNTNSLYKEHNFNLNLHAKKNLAQKKSGNSSQIKVTKMLLIVSSVFVCLNLPSYIMRIKAFLIENDGKSSQATVITQYICWFFFITNFGINFMIYCLSGQNFRKALISMFKCKGCTKTTRQHDGTQVTISEYIKNSNSTASTKRRIITRKESSGNDSQELHYFNTSMKKCRMIEKI